MRKIKEVFKRILFFAINILTFLLNLFVWRSKRIIIFGAWMGTKFADNTRYLYQYLFENKKLYDFKKVIWITRNREVFLNLKKEGYDVLMCNSLKSYYYHIRAKYHIICNYSIYGEYKPDICSILSFGATRINCWHGVGFKNVGLSVSKKTKISSFFVKHPFFKKLFSCGGWGVCYYLSTSDKNKEVNKRYFGVPSKYLFLSSYPRHCKVVRMMNNEKRLIKHLSKFTGGFILYLPTFKKGDNVTKVRHPLENDQLEAFLLKNNIAWVEKPHFASKSSTEIAFKNVVKLDSSFDINVLVPLSKIIISDYSSVLMDGINLDIPIISFCPEADSYEESDVGFIIRPKKILGSLYAETYESFNKLLFDIYFKEEKHIDLTHLYKTIREEFFPKKANYKVIMNDLLKLK